MLYDSKVRKSENKDKRWGSGKQDQRAMIKGRWDSLIFPIPVTSTYCYCVHRSMRDGDLAIRKGTG